MEAIISFVDAYRDDYGVEPICKVLAIAPSTYHARVACRTKPDTAPARVKRDTMLSVEIKRVYEANFQVYGVRKVWRQMLREGYNVARCTVARLMKKMALQGVIRGRRVRTTVSDKAAPCPLDHVNRRFKAPRPSRNASERWSARTASCAKPTRSCARRPRILRWRSSTAGPSHDRLH